LGAAVVVVIAVAAVGLMLTRVTIAVFLQ
jgi:hypothetical protein